ncbi:hypothetical protein PENSPDRAFT_679866 [Peniophora sp. CONT]|nr:hypothetical protein PENSPDRAFT_679866 [Peniophora sp. CONT]
MSALGLSSPTRKRAREDDGNAGGTEPNVIRSPDFYFNDGTIVLRTLSTQSNSYTLFRVHKSLLALHCTVFRDMFGEGNSAPFDSTSEQCDGVPLMHLHDDVEDLNDFLQALYHPEFMYRHINLEKHGLVISDYPKMYASTMRLARKYAATRLIDIFAESLQRAWPSDWKTYNMLLRSRAEELKKEEDDDANREFVVDYDHCLHPNPGWSIRLAVDLAILSVLPSAYSALCALMGPGCDISSSTGRCDTTDEINESISVLHADELRCLLLGIRSMASYIFEHASENATPPVDSFRLPNYEGHTCYTQFAPSWKKMTKELEKAFGASAPLLMLRKGLDNCNLCQSCQADARAHINKIELDIWRKLPVIFDLHRYGVSKDWGS